METVEGAALETLFIHPPALLAASYVDLVPEPRGYYSARQVRSHEMLHSVQRSSGKCSALNKVRKKKRKQPYVLNPKELLAEQHRHRETRSFLLDSHNAFLSNERAQIMLRSIAGGWSEPKLEQHVDFVQLALTFQAPLYEVTFASQDGSSNSRCYQLFNNLVEATEEQQATCAGCDFVLPRASRFFTSDFSQLHQLTPEQPSSGYNLLVIDPPWENKSVHRKSLYPTLPNKYLLSLPLQRLVHSEGALVGLWITNREKLHQFVERELFPAWGLVPAGVWYWLKITAAGTMISPLDLHHHKPYECLLLARVPKEGVDIVPSKRVIISIPGQHSRKPPLGLLLEELAPGPRPVRALEMFARELYKNWTSWGNEPLRFQEKQYFCERREPASDQPTISQVFHGHSSEASNDIQPLNTD